MSLAKKVKTVTSVSTVLVLGHCIATLVKARISLLNPSLREKRLF